MKKEYLTIVEEYLSSTEYKLIYIEERGSRNNLILEIYVDCKGALNLDELADINRDLWGLFELKGLNRNLIKIVVSSPGIERPVRFHWQLYKNLGREVEAVIINEEKVTGVIIKILEDPEPIIILGIGKQKNFSERELLFKDIGELKYKIAFK